MVRSERRDEGKHDMTGGDMTCQRHDMQTECGNDAGPTALECRRGLGLNPKGKRRRVHVWKINPIIIMLMLLAPVVHAEEVWCEELTRIFVASQPPHCGHIFRQGEGPPPDPSRPGWAWQGYVGWVGATPNVTDSLW